MSTLVSCHELSKAHGERVLFDGLTVHIREGERLGVIGPNGSGKTTLLRILAGLEEPDSGQALRRRDLRLALVEQEPVLDPELTVEQAVARALTAPGPSANLGDEDARVRVGRALTALGLDSPGRRVAELSGGWLKRVAIARALVREPELLLLDEPTNHLDLEGVEWLERHLVDSKVAVVVVTHDRAFLQAVATRVMEIDRRFPAGHLSVTGTYADFVEKREAALETMARRRASLGSRVDRELEWLRRGPKARTTKARGRVEAAAALVDELAELRSRGVEAQASIDFVATGRKTRRLVVARALSRSFGGHEVLRDVDLLLSPGMRLGLVGRNGSGKTTLLRLLSGELAPDRGAIRRAPGLEVVYFDQRRETLDPDATVRRTLCEDGDTVSYRGAPVHVAGWARRFLFSAQELDMRVGRLSGGEQARLMVARLMLRPADVLLLDEPTNDLDIPTLEVLEESLAGFPGALVMVTHDRYLLDRVTTVLLGLDGAGGATPFADYSQWSAARPGEPRRKRPTRDRPPSGGARDAAPKLTWAEQREHEGMEPAILGAEAALEAAERAATDPSIASNASALEERYTTLEAARSRVEELYARWAELDEKHRVWLDQQKKEG